MLQRTLALFMLGWVVWGPTVLSRAVGDAAAAPILTQNFEKGFGDWQNQGATLLAGSDGEHYVHMESADLKGMVRVSSPEINVAGRKFVEVRFRNRTSVTNSSRDVGTWVYICFYDRAGNAVGTEAIICPLATSWVKQERRFALPPSADRMQAQFRLQQAKGTADWAGISIRFVDTLEVNTQDSEYAKAYRLKANLNYQKIGDTIVLASRDITLQSADHEAPYGFVLPGELCENPELTYEVECTFRPKWSSQETKDANMIFALGRNIMGAEPNSFNLTFWGGKDIISRLKALEGDVAAEIRTPLSVNAGNRYVIKARWSSNECTLWLNGQMVSRVVMPKKFVWPKENKFYIFGESKGRGLLNADVEQFSLRVYEPRIKAAFQGAPRDLGYFTGAGPFTLALSFPGENGQHFVSNIAVLDIQGKEIASSKPVSVTAATHGYTLPPLPFGWYKLEATITGDGAEKRISLPVSITPAAAIRESAEDSIYGITEEWPFGRENFDSATTDTLLYRLSQMGIRWFRAWFDWDYFEERPGVYYWKGLDQFLAIAEKYGIEVYPCLHGGAKPFMMPPKDKPLSHDSMISAGYFLPPDMAIWNNYVRTLATRYKGKIHYYQIWNEADTRQFLYPFKTNAYAAFLKETAAVIRAADPSAKIALGGFCAAYSASWINRTSHTDKDPAYGLAEWYAQKPQGDYDIVDCHFYSVSGANQSWDATAPLTETLRRYLAARGDGGKPIWNSETSFLATANPQLVGVPGGWANVPLLSEREQAYRLVQWHVQSKAVDIKHNFNYGVRGDGGPINSDFSAKPAYVAHITLANTLAGLKYERALPFNRNIRAYLFTGPNRCVTVLWTMDGSEILVARSAAADKPLTRIDLFGNHRNGEGVVVLTEEPVYFESPQPPVLQELIGLRLPEMVLAGVSYEAQLTIRNPFDGELRCAIDAKAAGKSETRQSFNIPGGKEITEPIRILDTGTPLTIEGTLFGAVSKDFYLELPVQPKKAVVVNGATPARFDIAEAAQVRVGGPVIDNQNRVMSEGCWKGKDYLSAIGAVTVRDRAVTVAVQVKDATFFPDQSGQAPWTGDGVEFFFDLRTDAQKTEHSMDGVVQLAVTGSGKYVIMRHQTLQDLVVHAEKTNEGYAISITFTLPAHIADTFGFDVSLDDADSATSGRKVQMVWAGTENNHANPSGYGVVIIK